jgi:iron complex outermembrane recepter protein
MQIHLPRIPIQKNILCIVLILLIGYSSLNAQDRAVNFKIVGPKGDPVPNATVVVLNGLDSIDRISKFTDSTGLVKLSLKDSGLYTLIISSINYKTLEKGFRLIGKQTNYQFSLSPESKTLAAVTVTSRRPLMRQEDDKTIVDPEPLVASSTSGYEVIEKTPGLFVDQDGNIYLSSSTPATIYINGREMKMSTADVATMLKNLPPNAISKIEILRTPSAKYDASGSGGIVNVVLKKGVKIGLTGSVTLAWQQGFYGNQTVGLSLNNNTGATTSYLNINYSKRNSFERILTDRSFAPDSLLSQNARTVYPSDVLYFGYGVSRELSPKWEFGYDGRTSLNFFNYGTDNTSSIFKISNSGLVTSNLSEVANKGNSYFLSQGLSAKYKIDSLGSQWSSDFSYNFSRGRTDQGFITSFAGSSANALLGNGDIDNDRHFVSGQTDLKWKFKNKFSVETGLKSTYMNYSSNTAFFRTVGSSTTKDDFRTNQYRYRENINAAYAEGTKTFGKDIILKLGLRAENTNMNGQQLIPSDTSFDIHRTDLFPYIYLSKSVMKIAGYDLRAYLVYRRTISRPAYEYLNPFPKFIDQYLFETGNPTLRPQFTQNIEANISVADMPILAFGRNYTSDIFTNVIYQVNDSSSLAYRTYDNLGKNRETYFRLIGAIPPGGKYFAVAGVQYNHNFYEGLYEGKPLSFKRGTLTFFTFQSLRLDGYSQLTLNGFLRLKGQLQFYELESFGQLNMSINRQFFKKKLTVTLSANDIFLTNRTSFVIDQGSVNASGKRQADTRRFGINLQYNFGFRKKEENKDMFNMSNPDGNN